MHNQVDLDTQKSTAKKASLIHWGAKLVLFSVTSYLIYTMQQGLFLEKPFYIAFLLCVILGVPSWLVWQTKPAFGEDANAIRRNGFTLIFIGIVINVVGFVVNYLLLWVGMHFPFVVSFVIIWYGVFVIGTFFIVWGISNVALGSIPSAELQIPWKNNK